VNIPTGAPKTSIWRMSSSTSSSTPRASNAGRERRRCPGAKAVELSPEAAARWTYGEAQINSLKRRWITPR
jgi:hypothetical protein